MIVTQARLSLYEVFRKAFPEQMNDNRCGRYSIKVDDETKSDVLAGFSSIVASIADTSSSTFTLHLDNLPCNEEVDKIAEELGGTWQETRFGKSLTLNLGMAQISRINHLAKAVRRVVGRGAQYEDRNWKWKAPRAAASLEEFVRELKAARKS